IALSYSIIAITVVALVVTAVLGRDSSSAPSQPSGVPGRTVAAVELPGMLLTLDEVKAIMAQQPGASPAPNLTAQQPNTEPVSSPGPRGTVTPDSCISSMIAGSDAAYNNNNNGYRAIYTVTMSQPGVGTEITQSVAVFDDGASAQRALDVSLGQQDECRDRGDLATIYFTEPGAAQPHKWTSGKPVKFGDYYMTRISFGAFDDPGPANRRDRYAENRTIAARGNVLVDVVVRGAGVYSQQQDVINGILGRLK
ncbi:MAG TPA: sensor domain-containing protein, partial [Mycobacterium sp.]